MTINQATLKKQIETSKLVSKLDLNVAQKTASHLGCSITDVLLGRGLIEENELGEILARYFKVKFVDLKSLEIPSNYLNLVPEELATERGVVVFENKNGNVGLAMEDPKDLELIELVRKTIGKNAKKVTPYVATSLGIKEGLKLYQTYKRKKGESFADLPLRKTTSAVVEVDKFLHDAIRDEASDIHIEPSSDRSLVRVRIDGVLHDQAAFPKSAHSSMIARVKVLSDLKLDEQRHPQDGQFSFETKRGEKISLRVSTTPTVYGEKVVLRILESSLAKFNLEELGLLPEDEEVIASTLERTHGMFLVTGPTGSGKTTTLYTALGLLNKADVNIVTIEDPVENRINRVNQIQVNPQIDLNFANGLRSVLRQDPDIIMVGEIRDKETAVIAVNSAMTGHLVFSSVHANTAAGAIPRMLDLGTEPFLLASTLNMVVAQRLVRILCDKCKVETPIPPALKTRIDEKKDIAALDIRKTVGNKAFAPVGCSTCHYTGFRGRTGIFEILRIDDEIKDQIVAKAQSNTIWAIARKKKAKTMLEDGLIKVSRGITSIEEVFRVISE